MTKRGTDAGDALRIFCCLSILYSHSFWNPILIPVSDHLAVALLTAEGRVLWDTRELSGMKGIP